MEKWYDKVIVSAVSTLAAGTLMGLVQANARISVLEVQVSNVGDLYRRNADKTEKQMNELIHKVDVIKDKVTELNTRINIQNNDKEGNNDIYGGY